MLSDAVFIYIFTITHERVTTPRFSRCDVMRRGNEAKSSHGPGIER